MNTIGFQQNASIIGDSEEDTALLRDMVMDARNYIKSFKWCPEIKSIYLAHGTGGVFGIFLVEFIEKLDGTDSFLWVIVGDLPSAYLVTDDNPNPKEAIEAYCEIMDDWITGVVSGSGIGDAFPVPAEPTQENARSLASRILFLRESIIPSLSR